jgi:hypothetical protein
MVNTILIIFNFSKPIIDSFLLIRNYNIIKLIVSSLNNSKFILLISLTNFNLSTSKGKTYYSNTNILGCMILQIEIISIIILIITIIKILIILIIKRFQKTFKIQEMKSLNELNLEHKVLNCFKGKGNQVKNCCI